MERRILQDVLVVMETISINVRLAEDHYKTQEQSENVMTTDAATQAVVAVDTMFAQLADLMRVPNTYNVSDDITVTTPSGNSGDTFRFFTWRP